MKPQKSNKLFAKRLVISVILPLMVLAVPAFPSSAEKKTSDYAPFSKDTLYSSKLEEYKKQECKAASDKILLTADDIVSPLPEGAIGTYKEKNGILFDENITAVEYRVSVPQDGLYIIKSEYLSYGSGGVTAIRELRIDGEIPFDEAANIPFLRSFRYTGKPLKNSVGDEVQPQSEEIEEWSETYFYDSLGKYGTPLIFHLSAGEHSIALGFVDQPAVFGTLTLMPPLETPSYSEYIKQYLNNEADGFSKRFEAEDSLLRRSDTSIRIISEGDPKVSPPSMGYTVLNAFGGNSWRKGTQTAVFEVEVPKASLYSINFRSKQVWGNRLPSCRNIQINGKTPFSEFESFEFEYGRQWKNVIPGSKEGTYKVYLDEGVNEISLSVNLGSSTYIMERFDQALEQLSASVRKVIMITGAEPDSNFDYNIENTVPSLLGEFSDIINILEDARKHADSSYSSPTIIGNNIESVTKQLEELIKKPDSIPMRIEDLSGMATSIGDWIVSLQDAALSIDYIEIFSPDTVIKNYNSSFFDNFIATVRNFFSSFAKDYNKIASANESDDANTVISVWIGRGREWAEILKELSDSDFTAKTGISINLNVLPAGQMATMGAVNPLMLAIGAGNAPDMAISVPSNMPVEYAIRNAVADLRSFDGFEDTVKNFPEQLMVPFKYEEGVYGVPETMYFRGMFYRKDIINELGIKVPNTWDEVFNDVLPVLYENGMQMYIPGWNDMFILSNGGRFYTEDGKKCALDTPQAYNGFKMLCDVFTVYGVPASANLFNRFRTGEMPIGIEGSPLYLQLMAAAPDLMGRWAMAPIPGVPREDGTIDRSTAGYAGESDVILSASDKKEACWKFIQWWTSTETQTRFGREVEGRIGSYARWLSSNTEAFSGMPWNRTDLKVIQNSWSTIIETPNVLGGYFTGRHLSNAWNRTVIGGMSARDSLEICIEDINTELLRRQLQYAIDN